MRARSASQARTSRSATAGPVLEQAEEAGIQPQSGCRMGICHSCTCRKVSGTVKNMLTEEVSSGPDESIQICVSAPLSDLVIDL